MSQNEPKINPATGYVHDDSQLEEKAQAKTSGSGPIPPYVPAPDGELHEQEKQEASE